MTSEFCSCRRCAVFNVFAQTFFPATDETIGTIFFILQLLRQPAADRHLLPLLADGDSAATYFFSHCLSSECVNDNANAFVACTFNRKRGDVIDLLLRQWIAADLCEIPRAVLANFPNEGLEIACAVAAMRKHFAHQCCSETFGKIHCRFSFCEVSPARLRKSQTPVAPVQIAMPTKR